MKDRAPAEAGGAGRDRIPAQRLVKEHEMVAYLLVSYSCGIAAIVDAYRRPPASWEHADRDRAYWGFLGILLTLFAVGLLYALAYLFLVVPRFGSRSEVHGDFKKDFGDSRGRQRR